MNYFIKLLLFKDEKYHLLFGFCAPTNNDAYRWREKTIDKNKQIVQYTSIFNDESRDMFLSNLKNNIIINIGGIEFIPNFCLRQPVFSDISGSKTERTLPVTGLHFVEEYWNLNKKALIDMLKKKCASKNGKELFKYMQYIFDILRAECGIDFSKNGERIGNFEYYTPCKFADLFEIKSDKSHGLIIRKKCNIPDELIVNCKAENDGRWICDEIKIFHSDNDTIGFVANEIISHYKISMWTKEHGKLVYASECSFMLEVNIAMSTGSNERHIQDPWTKELHQSASKYDEDINSMEKVTLLNNYSTITSKVTNLSPWREPGQEGKQLCSIYKKSKEFGAFIPKSLDKRGEIDSFLKVRQLIDNSQIKKVVLADPFFSVKSAVKLLSRISSENIELEIIMSLTSTDPDSNVKNNNLITDVTSYINENKNMLHRKLIVKNVLHGKSQAFHDRILIRYFKDGTIDGFLLSNSLNSAGQFFPYIIAPLEPYVCLETTQYLQNLTDAQYQKTAPKNEKVNIKILYNYCTAINRISAITEASYSLPKLLSGEGDLNKSINKCMQLGFFVPQKDTIDFSTVRKALPDIVRLVFEQMHDNPSFALSALGEAMYHCNNADDIVCNTIRQIPYASERFVKALFDNADSVEKSENHQKQSINSAQFIYWAIITGQAKPNVSYMLDYQEHVLYKKGYWCCLYRLLLLLDQEKFFVALKRFESPMMLYVLIEHLTINKFDVGLYKCLIEMNWKWMNELAALYLWKKIKDNQVNFNSDFYGISPEKKIDQTSYVLSKAAFEKRMVGYKHHLDKLYFEILNTFVELCNNSSTSEEKIIQSISNVNELDETSEAKMLYSIAIKITNNTIKNIILDRIIDKYFKSEKRLPYSQKNQIYTEIVVNSFISRYPKEHEKEIKKLLHLTQFYNYTEPYFKDRNYVLWSNAAKTLGFDFAFLDKYQKKGYKLSDKNKIYFNVLAVVLDN